jgi:hypothetical protein
MVNLAAVLSIILIWFSGDVRAATGWQFEQVENGAGLGQFTSLKVDKFGNAHLVYVVENGDTYPLRYAFRDHVQKRWYVMTVDSGASFCALVLDSQGHPHISYADYGTGSGTKVRYATWDGKAWLKSAVPVNADVVAYYTSIALDANDNPSISFYEYRGPLGTNLTNRMRNALWNGKYWEVRTVDPENGSGKFNSMAADAKGQIHLAYGNVLDSPGIRYGFWDGKTWKTEILEGMQETHAYVGHSVAMAVDKDGNPHITYMDASNARVKYAVRKDGRWQIQTVDRVTAEGHSDRNSIVIDDNGRPYVGYYDGGRGILKLAFREGQQWFTTLVDGNGAGFASSLQIVGGELWISYGDVGHRDVKFARINLQELWATSGAGQISRQTSPSEPLTRPKSPNEQP